MQPLWWLTKDGDRDCIELYLRHYSHKRYADGRPRRLFVGPGEKVVLRTEEGDAVFVWNKFISYSGQLGVNCSIFRNEGRLLSRRRVAAVRPHEGRVDGARADNTDWRGASVRDYSKASSGFWSGDTGKLLRSLGRDHQVVGFYLFTCHMANMIGLYYLPLPTLCHEVGGLDDEGALKVLRSLSEGGYAHYDERSEHVFVVEMAKHQVGERLSRKDNRHKAVVKLLEQFRKTKFFNDFLTRYRDDFELGDVTPNKALRRPLKAPSEPLRSQEQEQEQDQKQDQEHAQDQERRGSAGSEGRAFDLEDPGESWRSVEACDPQAYESWLAWRDSEHDRVPDHVRLFHAKFLAGKGNPEQQRAFVNDLIQRQFRRLHDPAGGIVPSNGSAPHRRKSFDEQLAALDEPESTQP